MRLARLESLLLVQLLRTHLNLLTSHVPLIVVRATNDLLSNASLSVCLLLILSRYIAIVIIVIFRSCHDRLLAKRALKLIERVHVILKDAQHCRVKQRVLI